MKKKRNIPQHVAIIMDGNGRWAKQRKLPRTAGHRQGVRVVEEIIQAASDAGIKVLTLYAFSTENWNRPRKEVNFLLWMLRFFLQKKIKKLLQNNVQLRTIGDLSHFPAVAQTVLRRAKEETQQNTGLVLNLALNYGSRTEILQAVRSLSQKVRAGELSASSIDEQQFSDALHTSGLPDPDLLIRTSGEKRLSNFMLWQISYAELYFPKKLWPDFTRRDFFRALTVYSKRQRRFGGIRAVA